MKPLRIAAAPCLALAALAFAACGGGNGDGGTPDGGDPFTSASFGTALEAVEAEVGANAELLRVQITAAGSEFQVREGERATGFRAEPEGGDLQDVEVQVIGGGSLQESAFPIADADPASIDAMVSGAREASGAETFDVTSMILERDHIDGTLHWTINGGAEGRTGLLFIARPDGSGIEEVGGGAQGADEAE